jgi:hypothetical protein
MTPPTVCRCAFFVCMQQRMHLKRKKGAEKNNNDADKKNVIKVRKYRKFFCIFIISVDDNKIFLS